MKHEFNSRRLFGITRSKGKMYEFDLPEEQHLKIPENSEPQELFILTIGTLGDVADVLSKSENINVPLPPSAIDELNFSASFFDAYIESKFSEVLSRDVALLASAAYYLARRPGSSLVIARQLIDAPDDSPVDKLLCWVLKANWSNYPGKNHILFGDRLKTVARLVAFHFYDGSGINELSSALTDLRQKVYQGGSSRDLLFVDIITAIIRLRLSSSAWTMLPQFTGISAERWANAIRKPEFPKELWPSQILLGKAGLFSGASGVVQMPTSAGKTRAIEIMLRSSFLAERTKLAVVVAPFRALCHEIGNSLRHAFRNDDVKVNEISDALQLDFLQQVAELFGNESPSSQYILVLTPEKLLYVLRQAPNLVADIGIVVYDEGHQFDSGSRGIIYELLLTEIKALLSQDAQTILVSAVIKNAQAIGNWLIGENASVVNGSGLLATSRAVAFSSWIEGRGQIMFFESNNYEKYDYFVPRVIEENLLHRNPREKERYFPIKNNSNDIALYLGIRLAPKGAVAIFCGRKDTASNMAVRAVEVYERNYSGQPPGMSSDADELRRLKNIIDGHFGSYSISSRAASLGIFVHHGCTPHGIRLSIEHAMQKGKINFVACTSTLAQGVNLPIRYLIVSGIYQGKEKLKVRDFQNLIGRAGRSGMHTEGLIIFSDPFIYDKRKQSKEKWRFNSSVELLSPDKAEATASSLLDIFSPIVSIDQKSSIPISIENLCDFLFSDINTWNDWAEKFVNNNPEDKFEKKALLSEIRYRRRLVHAIESHLMANRKDNSYEDFKNSAELLAESTLAYYLAADELKPSVKTLFGKVAEYLHNQEPLLEKQSIYSKTLLGVKNAKDIELWVTKNKNHLQNIKSNEEWINAVWNLFLLQLDDKFFHVIEPQEISLEIVKRWISGTPYKEIFKYAKQEKATKPWGETKRRPLTEDDIIDFCESTVGFECSLILAAVANFLLDRINSNSENSALSNFQKSLKYGLPDTLTISCYDLGFADRVLAQDLCNLIKVDGFSGKHFSDSIENHRERIKNILENYPSYFENVFEALDEQKI